MKAQAVKGGQIGVNGYFYIGGQFLPSTEEPPKGSKKFRANPQYKVEIAPYTWEVNREMEGLEPLFRRVFYGGCPCGMNQNKNAFVQKDILNREFWSHITPEIIAEAEELCNRYNNGERWILVTV